MAAIPFGTPIPTSCRVGPPSLLKRHLQWTWEDGVFALMTSAFFLSNAGAGLFHLYTAGVIILVLSLAFRRGLAVGLVRMAVLAAVLFWAPSLKGFPFRLPWMEVAGLAGCGLVAGMLGEMQRRSQADLQRSFCQTLDVLARALECRDPYTEGHSRRTARYAVAVAREMGLNGEFAVVLEQAGLLHDLGKIGIPDAILRKQGTLSHEEEEQMKDHAAKGSRILEAIPALAKAAVLVHHHHEHYDGSGYPDGLAGGAIPLAARILTVADVFDALTSDRPYRKTSSALEAVADMRSRTGQLFDPAIVDALEKTLQKGPLGYEVGAGVPSARSA